MPTPSIPSYPGYVYLIGSSQFGWFKIGKSVRPEIRVNDIGVMLPFKIELFALWGTSNHSFLESAFHKRHAAQRINGEWFAFGLLELIEIITGEMPYYGVPIFAAIPGDPPRNLTSSLLQNKKAKKLYENHFAPEKSSEYLQKHDLYLSKMIESLELKGLENTLENRRIFKVFVKDGVRKLLRRGQFIKFREALEKACYDFVQD